MCLKTLLHLLNEMTPKMSGKLAHLLKNILCFIRHSIFHPKRFMKNSFIHFGSISTIKRRQPKQHFIQNCSQAPPVNGSIVLLKPENYYIIVVFTNTSQFAPQVGEQSRSYVGVTTTTGHRLMCEIIWTQ